MYTYVYVYIYINHAMILKSLTFFSRCHIAGESTVDHPIRWPSSAPPRSDHGHVEDELDVVPLLRTKQAKAMFQWVGLRDNLQETIDFPWFVPTGPSILGYHWWRPPRVILDMDYWIGFTEVNLATNHHLEEHVCYQLFTVMATVIMAVGLEHGSRIWE